MRIKSIRIQNFRTYKDVSVDVQAYTCFVGANGAGKSNVLQALNVFFQDSKSGTNVSELEEADFCFRDTSEPIRITVTFCDLSDEAKLDLKDYVRGNELVVTAEAVFDPKTKCAQVRQFGQRLAMREFAEFFSLHGDGAKVAVLKPIYEEFRKVHTSLPAWKSLTDSPKALQDFEAANPDLCELLPSADNFYGFSGQSRLSRFIQWVYVPAIKNPTDEAVEQKNTALGQLLSRVVRSKTTFAADVESLREATRTSYEEMLISRQGALDELSKSLGDRFRSWSHPDASIRLQWQRDNEKVIRIEEPVAEIIAGESRYEAQLHRFGHGLQRSYLLTVLQELAANVVGDALPTLLLAIEEPELYQHPPQVKHLVDTLCELADGGSQVLTVSHSPLFVTGESFESLRLVSKRGGHASVIRQVSLEDLGIRLTACGLDTGKKSEVAVLIKLQQELQPQLSEMFFCGIPVLVEGLEDKAYLTAHLILTGSWKEFRRLGCHIVPVGGKNHLIRPYAICKELMLPAFVLFDSDAQGKHTASRLDMHKNDNSRILKLAGHSSIDPLSDETVWQRDLIMWQNEIADAIKSDYPEEVYSEAKNLAELDCGHLGSIHKDSVFISKLLSNLYSANGPSHTLTKVCDTIFSFAKDYHAQSTKEISLDAPILSTGGPLPADSSPAEQISSIEKGLASDDTIVSSL